MKVRLSLSAAVWLLLGAAFFLVPLAATIEFSLRTKDGYGLAAYGQILHDGQFWTTLWLSTRLALETIAISLALMIPTAYWVHLKVPRLRPLVAFVCVLPFVVPPIILVVGLLGAYHGAPQWFIATPQFLVAGYVILSLPYVWFSLDAGFRSIDSRVLTEAAQSLGAGWIRTLGQVILPNLRTAALSAALLTLAIVLGEFTMSNLALFNTFSVYINYVGETQAQPAAALSTISFVLVWGAMLGVALAARGRRGARPA